MTQRARTSIRAAEALVAEYAVATATPMDSLLQEFQDWLDAEDEDIYWYTSGEWLLVCLKFAEPDLIGVYLARNTKTAKFIWQG